MAASRFINERGGTMANYINTLNKKLTTAEMQTNALFVRDYLVAKGWSVNAVAGLLGNWEAESRINPNVYEGYYVHSSDIGNYGYGLSQWTPWLGKAGYETAESQRHYHGTNNPTFGRWCLDNGRDKALMETQLDYVDTGLGGYRLADGYPESYAQFKVSTKGADYLAQLYYVNYERSAAGQWGDRPKYALAWYQYLIGNPGGGGTVDPPTPEDGTVNTTMYCNVVSGEYVNIRSGPGTTYEVLGILHRGDAVYVTTINNGWAKITSPVDGYVMASFLQTTNPNGGGSTDPDPEYPDYPFCPPECKTDFLRRYILFYKGRARRVVR